MGYVVGRAGAVRGQEVVAIFSVRERGTRSRLLLRDGSVSRTPTRPRTMRQALEAAEAGGYWLIAQKTKRTA